MYNHQQPSSFNFVFRSLQPKPYSNYHVSLFHFPTAWESTSCAILKAVTSRPAFAYHGYLKAHRTWFLLFRRLIHKSNKGIIGGVISPAIIYINILQVPT